MKKLYKRVRFSLLAQQDLMNEKQTSLFGPTTARIQFLPEIFTYLVNRVNFERLHYTRVHVRHLGR